MTANVIGQKVFMKQTILLDTRKDNLIKFLPITITEIEMSNLDTNKN